MSKVELLNKFAALNLRVIEVEGKNAELKMEVSAVTKRAELGERSAQDYKKLYEEILIQVEALQQQVRDYPQTVLDLQEEVRRLRQLASQNAAARVTEAETASTLANTAAQASSTPLASKVEGKE